MLEKSTYDKHWIKSLFCKVVCLYAMNIQKCKTATICICLLHQYDLSMFHDTLHSCATVGHIPQHNVTGHCYKTGT